MADENTTKVENKIDIFKYLMDKHGVEKVQTDITEAVKKQSGGFYRFKEGVQEIVIVDPPKAVIDERFKYSDGVGFTGVLKEVDFEGRVLDVKYPITFTTTQFWELVGQVKANFPEWSPLIDQSFDIVKDLRFEANTGTYQVNGEDRSKTRFAMMKGDNFTSKTMWIKEKVNNAIAKGVITGTQGTEGVQAKLDEKHPW